MVALQLGDRPALRAGNRGAGNRGLLAPEAANPLLEFTPVVATVGVVSKIVDDGARERLHHRGRQEPALQNRELHRQRPVRGEFLENRRAIGLVFDQNCCHRLVARGLLGQEIGRWNQERKRRERREHDPFLASGE